MKVITKIALLISTLLILNGCTEADIRALNNALNGYNGTSYGQSYQQRPVYIQPSTPKRCTTTYNSWAKAYYTNCW